MGPSGVTKQSSGAVEGEGERGEVGGAVIRYHGRGGVEGWAGGPWMCPRSGAVESEGGAG